MKHTFREKLNYRVERFMSKGGMSIFLSLLTVFTVGFFLVLGVRALILWINPELDYLNDFSQDIWYTFLQMTDPGNMYQDTTSPTWLKISTVLGGIIGVIILSMLIAFITTVLEKMLYDFRKGRGKVIENEHTLILGWNERVVDIIRELILANESEKKASVVILADMDKEEMDDLLAKRLPNRQTTSIITTQGDYANINELNRVNVQGARSIIILANCTESASTQEKSHSDVQSIKAVMAIISCQDGKNELPIITEIFASEKRELIGYFNDENIIAIDSWDIMGKLLVQTSLTSGLEIVYNEMLSFDGGEVYFHAENSWGNIPFYDLIYHFPDGIPMGIYNENDGLVLRPAVDYVMKDDDQILIFAEDDSTIDFKQQMVYKPGKEVPLKDLRMEQAKKRTLFLGYHGVADIFIREAGDYLLEGSEFDIMFNEPSDEFTAKINGLKEAYPDFSFNLIDSDATRLENLKAIDPFQYNNIVILSQDDSEQSADKIDSDTLIILLLLRTINTNPDDNNTKIITQVLNSENQEIIHQTDVDDFIISNKLITMILAQLSEEPLIKIFYDDIFSEDGSEIYIKPATLYFETFPQKLNFAEIIRHANKRDTEVCLGIRKGALSKDARSNFGVRLNLPKDEIVTITENDFLVVLSEDEL
jgi:hypothetical protein